MYSDVINLIVVTQGKNENGFPAETETKFEVYADKKSVSRSEFYQSMQVGTTATAVFDTRICDFEESTVIDENGIKHEATRVEHDSKKYNIIRTYSKDGEMLEITCSDLGVAQ